MAQRPAEIGIRIALGARQQDVLRMIFWGGLVMAAWGVAIGGIASWAATRLMAALLYSVTPHDPAIFALAPAVLVAIVILAGYIPARRAARLDPVAALRSE